MNRACDRPCKAICGFSSPTRLLTLHAGSFVRCLRRFRGGEFLEARIIPKRIEHPHRPSVVLLISHKIILLIAHIRANFQRSDVRMGFQERKYEPQEIRRRFQRGALRVSRFSSYRFGRREPQRLRTASLLHWPYAARNRSLRAPRRENSHHWRRILEERQTNL
jgi:hypothetical protein